MFLGRPYKESKSFQEFFQMGYENAIPSLIALNTGQIRFIS